MAAPRIKDLLDVVVAEGGSDIHLSACTNPIIRVSGSLVPLLQQPVLTPADTEAMLKEMLPPSRVAAFAENQSIDFSYAHAKDARFRVNGYLVQGSVAIAMRLAVSQMIAERAGHPLSLLILDEPFGSQDQVRQANMVGLIRRLSDTFSQVLVISHVEEIKDSVDSTITVRFDEAEGRSIVTGARTLEDVT